MTRLNIGIAPAELCDQHLLAEYRELPRMVAYAHRLDAAKDLPPLWGLPTLGRGHMRGMVRHGGYLASRHQALIDEMQRRVFAPTMPAVALRDFPPSCRHEMAHFAVVHGRLLIQARIRDRLRTMKRPPRWTNTTPPAWAM
jgi:hypothetical protein